MIPEQYIEIKWYGSNKSHYLSKGYIFTKVGDAFSVHVSHLPKASNVYVKFTCDFCNGENQKEEKDRIKKYSQLNIQRKNNNKDCCNNKDCVSNKLRETKLSQPIPIGSSCGESHPSLIEEWNLERNLKSLFDYRTQSNQSGWWKCSNGHEWEEKIQNRSINGFGCPYCSSRRISLENCLMTKFPELAQEWHPTKNGKLTPNDVQSRISKRVWWQCSKCKYEWKTGINNRTYGTDCPRCVGKVITETNNLLMTNPEVVGEWAFDKNKKPPEEYFPSTHTKAWWKCNECASYYKSSIANKVRGKGCPFCRGLKVNHTNSLGDLFPDIAMEWHEEKNLIETPFTVSKSSNKEVWWKCYNGHEWITSVNKRVNGGHGCPYCSGHRATRENCLGTNYPELVIEWNYDKNAPLTPLNIQKNSNKKVWWICKTCSHEWESPINNRSNGNGCPQCKESKGEKRIREFLSEHHVTFEPQYSFNDLLGMGGKNLKFDFAIFQHKDLKLLVEFDGIFHYESIYKDDGHERIKTHDQRKNEYCNVNNIPLLRIPYWEMDNIEIILAKELNIDYQITS